jgi:hypothetical protein
LSKLAPALFVAAAQIAVSQTSAAEIKARMEDSLRKQAESVARQMEGVRTTQPHAFSPPPPLIGPPLVSMPSPAPACDPLPPGSMDSQIKTEGDKKNIAPELVRAVISAESAFVPCAVSNKGAMGLMQLMPDTAKAMGVTDPMDPGDNLRGGVRYLGQLLERYGGDLSLALSAYNAGPATVDKYGGIPPIPETQNYVREILKKITTTPPALAKP